MTHLRRYAGTIAALRSSMPGTTCLNRSEPNSDVSEKNCLLARPTIQDTVRAWADGRKYGGRTRRRGMGSGESSDDGQDYRVPLHHGVYAATGETGIK
jgi:hypothetical protein